MDFVDVGRFVKLETAPIMQGSGVFLLRVGEMRGSVDIPDGRSNETAISCMNCRAFLGTWVEVKHAMKVEARKIVDFPALLEAQKKQPGV
jgi:hypothetical protein